MSTAATRAPNPSLEAVATVQSGAEVALAGGRYDPGSCGGGYDPESCGGGYDPGSCGGGSGLLLASVLFASLLMTGGSGT